MSFDNWLHLIEAVLVTGIFGMTFWMLRMSRKRQKRASRSKNV